MLFWFFFLVYSCNIPFLILTNLPLLLMIHCGKQTLSFNLDISSLGELCFRLCICLWTAITNGSVSLLIMNLSSFRSLLWVADCLGCYRVLLILLFTCCEFEEVLMFFWIGSSSVLVLPALSTTHFSRHDFFVSMSVYLILV